MFCALCKRAVSVEELIYISLWEMQQAAQEGFNPFETPGIDNSSSMEIASLSGISAEQILQSWRQRVMTDTTDWGLCPACAEAFYRIGKRRGPKRFSPKYFV